MLRSEFHEVAVKGPNRRGDDNARFQALLDEAGNDT